MVYRYCPMSASPTSETCADSLERFCSMECCKEFNSEEEMCDYFGLSDSDESEDSE